jgi:tetratricopeptide (TPR) repeat protein
MNAERLFLAGLSAYQRGEREVPARYCERALRDGAPGDALTVRLSHLYLVSTELWWNNGLPLRQVRAYVDVATEAAARSADPALQALAECLHGRYLLATDGLPEAVAVFTRAVELAGGSGSVLARLEALADLGHHLVGLNLNRGIGVLGDALSAADRATDAPAADLPLVRIHQARIPGLIGVAAYDAGWFGEAEASLRRSVRGLAALHAWDQFAMISNYLAQLLTETGRFAEAEEILRAALAPLQAHADLSTHQGYNLGLLGKCYLDWGKFDAAAAAITAGWDRVATTGHQAVLPILRNYLGELAMHQDNPRRDPDRARELFDETIAECGQTGFRRSEVGALALRAVADLAAGRLADALDASERAVSWLDEAGTLPALRTEEVYLTRYKVLRAAGAEPEAAGWADRARQTLMAKAASLASPQLRSQFLSGTPVSREIIAATADG